MRSEGFLAIPFRLLLLGGVDRLANQQRWIRSRPRADFLRAPIAHFRDVEIPFLIDAHAVGIEEPSGPLSTDWKHAAWAGVARALRLTLHSSCPFRT